jgi:hypothetical protein
MWVGDVLEERFAIERPIGQGGMGSVFVALDRRTGARVAVKTLDIQGEGVTDRFDREARALAEVAHPAVVRYLGSGRTPEGEAYLVMEWLEGEDLAARIARGPLPIREALTILCRAAEGLAVAHARGIVHRDVKPSNLFLVDGDPSRLKVLDFGIARVGATQGLTRTGALLGTVGYMAPEQALDPKRADARADVFSLGCVLYECLTGSPPYSGSTPIAVLSKLLSEDVPAPSVLRPGIPLAVDELAAALLARTTDDRPADASVVAERARRLESIVAIDVVAPTLLARVAAPPATSEQRTTSVVFVRGEEGQADSVLDIVGAFGGTATRLAPGTWLVTLASAGAASDRAQRAVACALALRDAWLFRVVVATGRAEATHISVTGPAIDRGAALLDTATDAPAGTVLVDDVTASLVEAAYTIERAGPHAVLVSARADTGGARLLMGKPTPFVGREKDLAVLEATVAESIDEGVARVVVVTAAPGIGKSRLRRELMARLGRRTDVKMLFGRGEIGVGAPLAVARQLARAATGASADLPPEAQAAAIEAHVSAILAAPRARHVAEFMAALLGVALPGERSIALRAAQSDPGAMGELLPRALDEWLAAECAAQPVTVLIEDLHWADAPTVDLVARAARVTERPLSVLAFARPEARDSFPQLWALSPAVHPLAGLGARAAERLARAVLGVEARAEDVARAVALADGNAFYLEELTRAIGEGRGATLPESVLAMAEARLDALEPAARHVLRVASVLGERFAVEAACQVVGDPRGTREWLEALADREVLDRADDERARSATELSFRHALLREAAYAQLGDTVRRALHGQAAAWFEGRARPDALAIAEHWDRAAEPARAIPWLAVAASAQAEAGELLVAADLGRRGLAMGAEGPDRGRLELAVAKVLVEPAPAEAAPLLLDALGVLPEGSGEWFHAAGMAFVACAEAERSADVAAVVGRLVANMDMPFPAEFGPGYGLFLVGNYAPHFGNLALSRSVVARMRARSLEVETSPQFEFFTVCASAAAASFGESAAGLLSSARTAATLAAAMDTTAIVWNGRIQLGYALMLCGAHPLAEAEFRGARARGPDYRPGTVSFFLGWAVLMQGRDEEALAELRPVASLPSWIGLTARGFMPLVYAASGQFEAAASLCVELEVRFAPFSLQLQTQRDVRAQIELHRGNPAEALRLADHGLELARVGSQVTTMRGLLLARARALHALGRLDEARATIRDARDRVLAYAASIEEPEIREQFPLRATYAPEILALAREWLGE